MRGSRVLGLHVACTCLVLASALPQSGDMRAPQNEQEIPENFRQSCLPDDKTLAYGRLLFFACVFVLFFVPLIATGLETVGLGVQGFCSCGKVS